MKFFPTPYPDEIFYSVVCRYHIRSGNNSARQTNVELWDRILGKGLLFPAGIEHLESKFPQNTNLTAERFIAENTIFPFLKPFIPKDRGEIIFEAIKNGGANNVSISSIAGLAWTKFSKQKYLRCCGQCIRNDIMIYGEAYWHRLHQLPDIYLCPEHGTPIVETNILILSLPYEFYQAVTVSNQEARLFKAEIAEKMAEFSCDAEWLLIYGNELGYYEETNKIYDTLLKAKGFRDWNGKTKNKKLGMAMAEFYGKDFLDLFDAYSSGVCQWNLRLLQQANKVNNPMYHLLLIRFLAGSVKDFFWEKHENPPEYLPFGVPPYPCRNKICDYHLADVIEKIFVKRVNGEPRAIFSCPHCGMTYRRKRNTPKEKQYSGQIDIIDYGWLWKERLNELLLSKTPIYIVAKLLYCDIYTVLKFGVECGILEPERLKKRKPYVPKGTNHKKIPVEEQRNYYRQRWKSLRASYPEATRSDLILFDSSCYEWLRINDRNWFEQNSIPPKKSGVDWKKRDNDYLALVKDVVEQFRKSSDKPKRITVSALAKKTGIGGKFYERLSSGRLPETKLFVDANLETSEQWRNRKIFWAVQTLLAQGRLNLKNVKILVSIEHTELKKLKNFIVECIEQARQ